MRDIIKIEHLNKSFGDVKAVQDLSFCVEDKKKGKTEINKQFEYDAYIRDFFADNFGKSLEQAIKCWKYKKQLQGHNRYKRSDLIAIE